ncbi:hypothetical protein A2U01_0005855 [Trifolium medium]|uniref:Uncharacterized protein n=1 Tax=Trifolium medium TaxID=97028 RepID=A0A392MFH2_9FABA|nr:hypothetical protein [Trifolium medium]
MLKLTKGGLDSNHMLGSNMYDGNDTEGRPHWLVSGTMLRSGRSFRCYHEGEVAISPLMCNEQIPILGGASLHKGEISRQHQEKKNPSSALPILEENVNSVVRHWFLLCLTV